MATSKDVALKAGVSRVTVYRVLNNIGYISDENKNKVLVAVKELNYSPDLIARGLKTKTSGQFLFIVPNIRNPFYADLYKGIEIECEKHGYITVILNYRQQINYIDLIKQRNFDGVIISESIMENSNENWSEIDIPIIILTETGSYHLKNSKEIVHETTTINGAEIAVDYLISLNHKKIGAILYSTDTKSIRFSGYKKALEKNNIKYNEKRIATHCVEKTDYHNGYESMKKLIRQDTSITAVFAANDMMAIGAIAYATEKGISIPEKISIIGYDNITEASFISPPLTTIDFKMDVWGSNIIKTLLKEIQGKNISTIKQIEPKLIIRKSTRRLEND